MLQATIVVGRMVLTMVMVIIREMVLEIREQMAMVIRPRFTGITTIFIKMDHGQINRQTTRMAALQM